MTEKSFGGLAQTRVAEAEAAAASAAVAKAALEAGAKEHAEASAMYAEEAVSEAAEEYSEGERVRLEAEERKNREEVASLGSVKGELEKNKQELAEEVRVRQEATRAREAAERTLEDSLNQVRAADPSFTLTTEDALASPDFADFKEVLAVKAAQAAEEQARASLVGTPELTARLAALGVEVSPGFNSEAMEARDVTLAMSERERTLVTDIFEARFKIPSERDAVVTDIIAQYKPKLERIRIGGSNEYAIEGSFKDVKEQLERETSRIPVCSQNEEVRTAVMGQVIKEALLKKNNRYQEEAAKKADYETRLAASEASAETLPQFLAVLNEQFYGPLQERFDNIDDHIVRDIWNMPEFTTLESLFDINYREGKIVGIKTPDKTVPSAASMEASMKKLPDVFKNSYRMDAVLKKLDKLGGVTYDDFRARRNGFSFDGDMRGIVQEFPQIDTVPREYRRTEESMSSWNAGFTRSEDIAQNQAQDFLKYRALSKEMVGDPDVRAKQEQDALRQKLEAIRISSSRLAADSGRNLQIEGGRVFDTRVQDTKVEKRAKKVALTTAGRELEAERKALGKKPEGLFAGKSAKETWDREDARLAQAIKDTREEIDSIDRWIENTPEDITQQLALPEEIITSFEGAILTAGTLSEGLLALRRQLEPEEARVNKAANEMHWKREQLDRAAKQAFFEPHSTFN